MPVSLVAQHAASWSRIAREVIDRPYPSAAGHVARSAAETSVEPQRLHPAFWGSLDWHSCVHMTWSLVTLIDRYAEPLAAAGELEPARALVSSRLRPELVSAETDYLRSRPGWERPYGWAWAAMLGARVQGLAGEDTAAQGWWEAVPPLVDVVAEAVLTWLPRQAHPVRHGTHANSAFSLSLLHTAYRGLGREDVVDAVEHHARDWFRADEDMATRWEPSGSDFLSPALSEAELMARVLPGEVYAEWLEAFLPGLAGDAHRSLLQVPEVRDDTDGQLVHLHGLALSRAWQLRALADVRPGERAAVLREAADRQVSAVLPQITGGDFMTAHWLVSFALLAEDGLH